MFLLMFVKGNALTDHVIGLALTPECSLRGRDTGSDQLRAGGFVAHEKSTGALINLRKFLMSKTALIAGLLMASVSTVASAGFFGGIAEHALGYAAGGVVAHEADRAIDGYHSRDDQSHGYSNGSYSGGSSHGDDGRSSPAPVSEAVPNPSLTPGVVNPAVTQANLNETICRRGGYTKSIRPPESYTYKIKVNSIREYGYADKSLQHYELDHLISLEVGGDPSSPQNLWPEPHYVVGGWGSYAKDKLENKLHSMICGGEISLAQAQHEEATDWISAYKKYIGQVPDNRIGR